MTRAHIYRPWGRLDWLLPHLNASEVVFLGCLSSEDRSLTSFQLLENEKIIEKAFMSVIHDEISQYTEHVEERLKARTVEFSNQGKCSKDVSHYQLLTSDRNEIVSIPNSVLSKSGGTVIYDITSYPKRFMFPILKMLIRASHIDTLVTTYTFPCAHGASSQLAENFQNWEPLPTFHGSRDHDGDRMLIIGVGHATLGLPSAARTSASLMRKCALFPTGGSPQSTRENWRFLESIERESESGIDIEMVPARDTSLAFDKICSKTLNPNSEIRYNAVFAPYGPKPLSMAMCIYATLMECAVYYTQPAIYHPDYTTGVEMESNKPNTFGYVIKLDGRVLYEIPS